MSLPFVLTITGATCSGKSTLESRLLELGWAKIRSFTTRAPRAGEIDGREYDFRDRGWVSAQLAAGNIVEIIEREGQEYGVTVSNVEEAVATGKPVVKVLDPAGVVRYREVGKGRWHVQSLFLNAEPELVCERFLERYRADAHATPAVYAARLAKIATEELRWGVEYRRYFDMHYGAFSPKTEDFIISAVLSARSRAERRAA